MDKDKKFKFPYVALCFIVISLLLAILTCVNLPETAIIHLIDAERGDIYLNRIAAVIVGFIPSVIFSFGIQRSKRRWYIWVLFYLFSLCIYLVLYVQNIEVNIWQ